MSKESDTNKPTGILTSWVIDQAAVIASGLSGKVDIVDMSIFEMLLRYTNFDGCRRKKEGEKEYYLFSWELVKQRLPFCGITGRSSIKARFKKLCNCDLLEAHISNVGANESWYCWGKNYEEFKSNRGKSKFKSPSGKTDASTVDRPANDTPPSGKPTVDRPANRQLTVRQTGCNESTSSESTSSESTKVRVNAHEREPQNPIEQVIEERKKLLALEAEKMTPPQVAPPPPSGWQEVEQRIGLKQATILMRVEKELGELGKEKFEMILKWLKYKKEKRQSYTSHDGVKAIYQEFLKNSPKDCKWVLDQSITSNYSGIFFDKLKNRKNGKVEQESESRKREAIRAVLNRHRH